MATRVKLKATFLLTLLLVAEASRVLQFTSVHDRSAQTNATKANANGVKSDESLQNKKSIRHAAGHLGNSKPSGLLQVHTGLVPPPVIGIFGLAMKGGFSIVPIAHAVMLSTAGAPVAAAAVGGNLVTGASVHAAWTAWVLRHAAGNGVGMLAKPVITRLAARRAGQAVVVAATRTGLIKQAAVKVLPWAFTATPMVGQAFMVANIALTGWQLSHLAGALRDPTMLCGLAGTCAPGGIGGPPVPPADLSAGLDAIVDPEVALAVLAVLVVAGGGAWMWHRQQQRAALDQAFCPRSTWKIDPAMGHEELPGGAVLEDQADLGMPHCRGYYFKALKYANCDLDDVPCRHLACQQACCNRKGCKAYQFTNEKGRFNFTSGMACYLTDKTIEESDCEGRWFGESRSNFDPDVDETKVVPIWKGVFAEAEDPDPYRLREERWTAIDKLGHKVQGLKSVRPESVTDSCDLGGLDEKGNLKPLREQCERKQCRDACLNTRFCIFYQYQRKPSTAYISDGWTGVDSCRLGISHELKSWRQKALELGELFGFGDIDDESYMQSHPWKTLKHFQITEWHGGSRSGTTQEGNGCDADHFACPSNGECVAACKDCEGFSLSTPSGLCDRNADQGICDPSSWDSWDYNGAPMDELVCDGLGPLGWNLTRTGLVSTTVKVQEDGMFNGHNLCREVCCENPRCKLYQLVSEQAGDVFYKKGSSMTCYLGMVDSLQRPQFKCAPGGGAESVKSGYDGGHLFSRGCPEGTLACSVTNDCVTNCATQCTDAPSLDKSGTSCTKIPDEDIGAHDDEEMQSRNKKITDDWKQDDPEQPGLGGGEVPTLGEMMGDEDGDCPNPPCFDMDMEESGGIRKESNSQTALDDGTFFLASLEPTVKESVSATQLDLENEEEDLTESSNSAIMKATAETALKIAEPGSKIVSQEHRASMCSLLTVRDSKSCTATEDLSGCKCSFEGDKKKVCLPTRAHKKAEQEGVQEGRTRRLLAEKVFALFEQSLFDGAKHLRAIFTSEGVVLLAGQGCTCTEQAASEGPTSHLQSCTFTMENELPPKVKLTATDEFTLKLTPD